jgi:PTS system mannose-specific IIA component
MIGILVVSHGALADALISEVQFLTGSVQKIKGVSIQPKEKREEIKSRIHETLEELDDGDGVIILTDALGGTPTNASLPFLNDRRVEVVTGVNVPMLLTLSSYRKHGPFEEICTLAKQAGRRSIVSAKKILGSKLRRAEKISTVSHAQKALRSMDGSR